MENLATNPPLLSIFLTAWYCVPFMVNSTLENPCVAPRFIKPLIDFLECLPNNANVIASIMLDLPAPLWPTKTVTPFSKSNFVSECDKKSPSSIDVIIFLSPF